MSEALYQLVFYVPVAQAEKVKNAVFAAGAGRIGHYDRCCWQIEGLGQFRPLAEANPYLGETGVVECVSELRVEMVCEAALIHSVVMALKQAHPYEEPAYSVWRLCDF
jgi:hypothetical protein